jgi:hypothetical protein
VRGLRARAGRRSLLSLPVALGLAALLAMPALAAAPDVNTGTGITVDGSFADWTEADFFADMYRAGDPEKEVESHLFLRYDCDADVLYVGVVAADGVTIIDNDADNFVKFGDSDKKVDGSDAPPDGTQPEFAYAAEGAGWEASFAIGEVSITDLNVHAQVEDDGSQTSAVADRAIPMNIACEQGGEELSASLTIIKDAEGEDGAEFAFGDQSLADGESFTINFETDDFTDGSVDVTVTESLTADQVAALWGLEAIACDESATWDDDLAAASVAVTVPAGDDVTCTFFNVQDREGTAGGNPPPDDPDDPEVPDTALGSIVQLPAIAVSIAFIAVLGALMTLRVAQRR